MKKKLLKKQFFIMPALICIIYIITFALSSCDKNNDNKKIGKEDVHSVMFRAQAGSESAIDPSEDDMTAYTYTINYDGMITYSEYYNVSGTKQISEQEMSDEDYTLLRTCLQDEFVDYEYTVDACDGGTWTMTYYDMQGNTIDSFQGYIYGSELLESKIEKILDKYR